MLADGIGCLLADTIGWSCSLVDEISCLLVDKFLIIGLKDWERALNSNCILTKVVLIVDKIVEQNTANIACWIAVLKVNRLWELNECINAD